MAQYVGKKMLKIKTSGYNSYVQNQRASPFSWYLDNLLLPLLLSKKKFLLLQKIHLPFNGKNARSQEGSLKKLEESGKVLNTHNDVTRRQYKVMLIFMMTKINKWYSKGHIPSI